MSSRSRRSARPVSSRAADPRAGSDRAGLALTRTAFARMFEIHNLLNRGSGPTRRINCATVARMLTHHRDHARKYSQKTIQRDLAYMKSKLKLPIEYDIDERSYAYTRPNVAFPVGPDLSQDERIALSVARQSLDVFRGVNFAELLASAHDKLFGGFLTEHGLTIDGNLSEYISVRTPGAGIVDPKVFRAVVIALLDRLELKVEYQSKGQPAHTARRLAPYHLACVASRWVLIARDLEKDQVRTYILARLRRPVVDTTRQIQRPERFDVAAHLGSSFGVWTGRGEIVVQLRLTPEAAHHVIERHWHPTQRITELPGGGVEVGFKLSDLNDITRWILGFGGDVEVLGPPELREAVAEEGRRMAARNARVA